MVAAIFGLLGLTAKAQTIFSENIGTGSGTQTIAATIFQNSGTYTYSGTGDTRDTQPSTGYTGASGGKNVYLPTTSLPRTFQIEGINTGGYSSLSLSFGAYKTTNASNMLHLVVEYSTDGIIWSPLTFPAQPTGTGTAIWRPITITGGTIPSTSNLRLRWSNTTTAAEIRIDDIKLVGTVSGPLVNFTAATSSHNENAGSVAVGVTISPPAAAAGTISFTITGGTATYGTGNDYTTTPAAVANVVTVSVGAGATTASFNVNIIDDVLNEGNETINFSITGVTGGLNIGSATTHVLTIVDDDNTPTVEFGTLNVNALEGAGAQTFSITITTPAPSASITIQVTGTATYGAGNDYTTSQPVVGGLMTIGPFSPAATSISYTATPLLDGLPEPTEHVTFTIISVSDPSFMIGPNSSATLYIGDIDSPPAVFNPGDLVVVGVNANNGSCGGASGDDQVSFFCFKEITYGTELIITDQGYERCNPGQWGNGEGTVRMRRTGPAIPAGQVVTFKITNTTGAGNIVSLAPDNQWTCTNLNAPSGGGGINAVNLNVNGDQLFFMQGGTWNSGTAPLGANANNATYDGTILYAFSTNPTNPWSASCSVTPNQRSNLPPGVECFSTAPTLASDFNKYIGPVTAATQRDWIIRLDNTANWASYASCAIYNSSGYNWLSAPIMPILPGGMTHGLWRGVINGDWFECKNWDDARIPDAATNVLINATANANCIVGWTAGLNPGGTGVCASLTQTTGTTVRQLTVDPNSTLDVGGLFLLNNTGSANILTTTIQANATLNAGTVELRGYDGTVKATLRSQAAGSRINVAGYLTIDTGSNLEMATGPANFGSLYLGGDFINNEDENHFTDNFTTVVLNGSGDQYIRNNNPSERFYDLHLNKPGGDVYLTAPISVRHQLDFTQGRLFTTATELPTLEIGATAINASNASFAHGPFNKLGNTDFTFPIGKDHSYRPASLSGITGGITVGFTAEYFRHPGPGGGVPGNPFGLAHDPSLDHVSDCEHWQIDRSSGTPNATVTLSWRDPESCGVTNPPDMRVAYWNGSLWENRGGSPITGNALAGTVSTATVQSSFLQATNNWTLASISAQNPLPIELLSFTARIAQNQVDLEWATASEKNNHYFTVERSADAMEYTAVLQVPGAGNSQQVLHYADVDRSPLQGLSYYRLRQTDYDGGSEVSDAVPVFFSGGRTGITVLYAADGLYLEHGFAPGSRLEVLDATGRLVQATTTVQEGPVRLQMDGLAHGAYVVRLTDGLRVEAVRVAY